MASALHFQVLSAPCAMVVSSNIYFMIVLTSASRHDTSLIRFGGSATANSPSSRLSQRLTRSTLRPPEDGSVSYERLYEYFHVFFLLFSNHQPCPEPGHQRHTCRHIAMDPVVCPDATSSVTTVRVSYFSIRIASTHFVVGRLDNRRQFVPRQKISQLPPSAQSCRPS